MFQVTFKFIGNNDLQVAYFEREMVALGFIALASKSDLVTKISGVEFVILSGL